MTKKIRATFIRKKIHDSGRDQAPDYYVYEFENIIDSKNNKLGKKWFKETKLLQAVKFQKGKEYKITLSQIPHSLNSINLPFPTEILWDKEQVCIRGGNTIIRIDGKGIETNLSVSITKLMGISNFDTAAYNKFSKGLMTEDLLKKMNYRGVFFYVHYYNPQDKRKTGGYNIGYTKQGNENYILIQKETQEEIDEDLIAIKKLYFNPSIENHFNIKTEILKSKREKK